MSEGNVYEELLNSGPFAIIELFQLQTFESMHGSDERILLSRWDAIARRLSRQLQTTSLTPIRSTQRPFLLAVAY